MLKLLTMWITTNCGKFLEMGIPDHLTCLLKNPYAGHEATIWTRRGTTTRSILEKEYNKTVYCHPANLTYMQSISCEMLGWMKHKLESRLPGKIWTTSDIQMIPLYWRKWRGTNEPIGEGERGEWTSWLKTQHSKKIRSWYLVPSLHGK